MKKTITRCRYHLDAFIYLMNSVKANDYTTDQVIGHVIQNHKDIDVLKNY